jgi:anti-sigma factor RsiW
MNFDDTLLMAYVDGELPPSRHTEIERAVESSKELAARVADLRASAALPYRLAFAQQALPPVPESLSRFVAGLAQDGGNRLQANLADLQGERFAEAANAADVDEDEKYLPPDVPAGQGATQGARPEAAQANARGTAQDVPAFAARAPRGRYTSAWLAAAFVAGAFFCGAALKLGPRVLPFERVSPWVEAAAGYQELYTRETLADTTDNPPIDARLLDAIRRDDGLPLAVPDLQNAGLTFKRLQRLRFHGKPLVQIVYLPEHGAPIALCVIKNQAEDQAAQSRRVYGMDVVTWNRDKLGYALIGQRKDVDLPALARQIADHPDRALAGGT